MKKAKNPNVVIGDYKRPFFGFFKKTKSAVDKNTKPNVEAEFPSQNQGPQVRSVKRKFRLPQIVSSAAKRFSTLRYKLASHKKATRISFLIIMAITIGCSAALLIKEGKKIALHYRERKTRQELEPTSIKPKQGETREQFLLRVGHEGSPKSSTPIRTGP